MARAALSPWFIGRFEEATMFGFYQQLCVRCLREDEGGQDLVEYALLAGLVAVAAGLFLPGLSTSMDSIYSKLASKLAEASS